MFHFALGKLGAAIKAGTGSAGVVPLFSRDYEATGSLGADATFTRASTATIIDHEGVIRTVPSGCARFNGLRYVRNLLQSTISYTHATDFFFFNCSATTGQTDPHGGTDAALITASVENAYFFFPEGYKGGSGASNGKSILPSIWVKGSGNIIVKFVKQGTGGSNSSEANVTLSNNWQRICPGIGVGGDGDNRLIQVQNINIADTLYVAWPQAEDVTGQTNQNPSEHVSVGVLSAPYHGANVDGVKYFATENGNTVSSNVVTEGTGAAITGGALLMEPAATNYLLNSGTPATQTTGSLGTGDYVLWVEGAGSAAVTAGTATITGGGTATDGTPDTFTVTGAGTVTVTVTGTLDRFQLEAGSVPTTYIPTSGSTVTRAADSLSYPLTTPQTEGMAIIVGTAAVPIAYASTAMAFLSCNSGSIPSWLYKNTNNSNLNAFDGTSISSVTTFSGGTAVGGFVFAARWMATELLVGREISGAWAWDTSTQGYDGAFTTTNTVEVIKGGSTPIHVKKISIYDTDQGTGWIEENY